MSRVADSGTGTSLTIGSSAIEKFGGTDYHLFALKLKMLLMAQSLWDTVTGVSQDVQKLNKALAIIGLCLKDNVLIGMGYSNITTPKEAWEKLETQYGTRTTASKLLLRQQLDQMKMEEGGDIHVYINKVSSAVEQLQLAGVSMNEEDVVARLLLGLPLSWKPLVTALENFDDKSLTRDYVTQTVQPNGASLLVFL
jgi:hypothetical protein